MGVSGRSISRGGRRYPRPDQGWALESALDVQMVSAVCPYCRILLVEARDNFWRNLLAAVGYAKSQGVQAISNSYGALEWGGETSLESNFYYPGGVVTASAGDTGYGVDYPAASRYVTAVGGPHSSGRRRHGAGRRWPGVGRAVAAVHISPSRAGSRTWGVRGARWQTWRWWRIPPRG